MGVDRFHVRSSFSEIEKEQLLRLEIEITPCARTIFIHELSSIRKRMSERSERVSFLVQLNE